MHIWKEEKKKKGKSWMTLTANLHAFHQPYFSSRLLKCIHLGNRIPCSTALYIEELSRNKKGSKLAFGKEEVERR